MNEKKYETTYFLKNATWGEKISTNKVRSARSFLESPLLAWGKPFSEFAYRRVGLNATFRGQS